MPIRAHATFISKEDSRGDAIRLVTKGLDLAGMMPAGSELRRLAEANGRGHVFLDLAEVQYLTAAALGKIVALHRLVSEAGGELTIRNVDPFPYEQFRLAQLDTVLTIWPK
jgi:anti-anti-sigma factor